MAPRRLNARLIKLHRTYTVEELADTLAVHKNTVRLWQRSGLEAIDRSRPVLFLGQAVRAFLIARRNASKRPCRNGEMYCLRCRAARQPIAGSMILAPSATTGNLKARCSFCQGTMYRRISEAQIASISAFCVIQEQRAVGRINDCPDARLHCDLETI